MKTNQFLLSAVATAVALGLIAVAIFATSPKTQTQAQGVDQPFGGQFTTITDICCDGTLVLNHRGITGFPSGSFQTSWSMKAYATLFYWPLPQTCAIGFVRRGGSCQTVGSECYSSSMVDYTITSIGTSLPGCSI